VNAVSIRNTCVDDADELRRIRLDALKDEPDAFGSTYAEAMNLSAEQWRHMTTDWNYFLAFDGSRAVGMASGGLYPPRPTMRWLYGMYVAPEWRGTGVAQRLVNVVASWARREGVDFLGLHVTESVDRARRFYERVGFVADGEREPMRRDHSLTLITMVTDLRTNDLI
jgi:GNAT superfamily N-acetyltransferase